MRNHSIRWINQHSMTDLVTSSVSSFVTHEILLWIHLHQSQTERVVLSVPRFIVIQLTQEHVNTMITAFILGVIIAYGKN